MRNGFAEYDGPIFEYLKMFQIKSGDEIAEQLFNFTDRGGRALAIRPEITPTLARMVNQKINSLPRPIKWFSVPRLCRAERPQKGRLREFFQWNIDIIGEGEVLADAEVIFTTVDYLREVGLTADDIVVKISSRKMLAALLRLIGIAPDQMDGLYGLLDKRARLPGETFEKMIAENVSDKAKREKILDLMGAGTIEEVGSVVELDAEVQEASDELRRLFELLDTMGVGRFCRFDIGVVRGLAYYTGMVFEIYDRGDQLRAICGGGRFDNLLRDFGGPSIPATGMGMGDCVLGILLEEKGLLKDAATTRRPDYFVAYADRAFLDKAIGITAKLRKSGLAADFSYKGGGLKKQLKEASAANTKNCIIIGQEYDNGELVVKDMTTGGQEAILEDKFWAEFQGRKG